MATVLASTMYFAAAVMLTTNITVMRAAVSMAAFVAATGMLGAVISAILAV